MKHGIHGKIRNFDRGQHTKRNRTKALILSSFLRSFWAGEWRAIPAFFFKLFIKPTPALDTGLIIMSKLLTGSICFTDLLEALKAGHSSGIRAQNKKVYVNINVWINDEKDKFGNDASIQINPKKDSGHDKKYIGNLKFLEKKEAEPVAASELPSAENDNLPF